jgi:hypothetical protein
MWAAPGVHGATERDGRQPYLAQENPAQENQAQESNPAHARLAQAGSAPASLAHASLAHASLAAHGLRAVWRAHPLAMAWSQAMSPRR